MIELLAGKAALSFAGAIAGKVARIAADVILPEARATGANASQGFRAELARLSRIRGILARNDPAEMPLRDLERLAAALKATGTITEADYEVLSGAHIGLDAAAGGLDRPQNLIDYLTQRRDGFLQRGQVEELMATNRAISVLEDVIGLRGELV